HGGSGISISPEIPNLAGQKAGYLAKAIRDFKKGDRKNTMMSSVVAMIADSDIDNIAAYYASLK
ncbi:MAG: cytochrome c, partial [Gammaproteobacteria bacterium]|nr:cytochrome c [Gammaproteobacteria bacterium]